MADTPSQEAIDKMRNFVGKYCEKSGTTTHPVEGVAEAVILGLASNVDELGRPLCPCRFYPDKQKRPPTAPGFVPAMTCRFTNTVTVCCLLTKRACPLPSTYPKAMKAARSTVW